VYLCMYVSMSKLASFDDDINALGTRYTKPIYLLPDFVSQLL